MSELATMLDNVLVLNVDILEPEYRTYALKFPVCSKANPAVSA
jgi:hypothetical protein